MPTLPALLAAASLCVPPPEARGFAGRPTLSGAEERWSSPSGRFVFHWTGEGVDALADAVDRDGDGVLDAVGVALQGLEAAWEAASVRGFRAPLPDLDGEPALDVYFMEIDANGYAYPSPDDDEEDPGTSCFLKIDAGLGDSADLLLPSVAAHELFHCVQFAHTPSVAGWFDEAHATYEQFLLFSSPTLDLARDVLWNQRLRGMDQAVSQTGGRFEYAGFILLKFWTERGGRDEARIPALWEALATEPDWEQTFQSQSESIWGLSWPRAFLDFATWGMFACARSDGQHWDPADLPCTLPAVTANVSQLDPEAGGFDIDLPELPDSAAYWELPAAGDPRPIELTCEAPSDGGDLLFRLVGIDTDGLGGEEADGRARGGEAGTATLREPLDPGGRVGIVVASTGTEPISVHCTWTRVEPTEPQPAVAPPQDGGCGCQNPASRGGAGGGAATLAILVAGRWVSRSRRCRTCPSSVSCSRRP